jgi:hypothetical protein
MLTKLNIKAFQEPPPPETQSDSPFVRLLREFRSKPLKDFARDFIKRQITLRNFILLLFVIINVGSSFVSGYFALQYGQTTVTEISLELRNDISARIRERVLEFVDSPQLTLQAAKKLYQEKYFNLTDPSYPTSLVRYLWSQFR